MNFSLFANPAENILFGVFVVIIALFLIVDLGIFNKHAQKISTRSAAYQTLFWIAISLVFGLFILYFDDSPDAAYKYYSAYLLEKALSFDNIFVILVIFRYFRIDEKHYHRILFWGILGAVVFRGLFIFLAIELIARFEWILYIFGAFLVYTGYRMFTDDGEDDFNPEKNPIVKFARRFMVISSDDRGGKFWFRKRGKLIITHLFLVLILIETTDIIFALDSIPAALSVVRDNKFVIYTSNIFAILGLRAMFFLLANIMDRFHYLQKGLSFVLIFIGVKMLLEIINFHIEPYISLIVIVVAIGAAIIYSYINPPKHAPEET
ncbi:MAG: TerC/Alx family metal homeostasis membrane protein [Bacteroidota bacterium]